MDIICLFTIVCVSFIGVFQISETSAEDCVARNLTTCTDNTDCTPGKSACLQKSNDNEKKCYPCRCVGQKHCTMENDEVKCTCDAEFTGVHCECRLNTDVCGGDKSGLKAHPTNCAMYYDCSDDSVLKELGEPGLRMCTEHKLFDTQSSSCVFYRSHPGCEGKYEPKNLCEYYKYTTPATIDTICHILGTAGCSSCELPGCSNGSIGQENKWYYAPGRTDWIVYCDEQRDINHHYCNEGYRFHLPDFNTCH